MMQKDDTQELKQFKVSAVAVIALGKHEIIQLITQSLPGVSVTAIRVSNARASSIYSKS